MSTSERNGVEKIINDDKERMLNGKEYYLKLTIHDNDFYFTIQFVSELLYEIFYFLDITAIDLYKHLPQIKTHIQQLLYSTSFIEHQLEGIYNPDLEYFQPDMELVTSIDIPDWDNDESAFIPLFEGDIIYR